MSDNYPQLQDVMEEYSAWVRSSARHILPYASVTGRDIVDFGCGRGDWLQVALELGAHSVLGLDTYALDSGELAVPYRRVDLTKPVQLDKRFDLAICMEVAEHLGEEYADILIASLVQAADVILFSAAVPGQGGIGHVNERPPAYWYEKFTAHGYACFDFRAEIWQIQEIEPWYRMGALLYVKNGQKVDFEGRPLAGSPLHLVHPDIFEAYAPRGRDLILRYSVDKARWYPDFL